MSDDGMGQADMLDAGDWCCQCVNLIFGLVALCLWLTKGDLYMLHGFQQCTGGGGTYDCEYFLTRESVEKYVGSDIDPTENTMISVTKTSPMIEAWVEDRGQLGVDDSLVFGLDSYSEPMMILRAVLGLVGSLGLLAFLKAIQIMRREDQEMGKCVSMAVAVMSFPLMFCTKAVSAAFLGMECQPAHEGGDVYENSALAKGVIMAYLVPVPLVVACCCVGAAFKWESYATIFVGFALCALSLVGLAAIASLYMGFTLASSMQGLFTGVATDCQFNNDGNFPAVSALLWVVFILGSISSCFSCGIKAFSAYQSLK